MAENELKGRSSLIPVKPGSLLPQALLFLVFGIILVAWPDATLKVLYIAFGIFALGYGAFILLGVFFPRPKKADKEAEKKRSEDVAKKKPDWLMVPIALVAIVAGILALVWPGATSTVILVILGIWAIGTGVIELMAGLRLPSGFAGKVLIIVTGLISTGFGIYLLVGPEKKGVTEVAGTVVILIGVFAILKGVLLTAYFFMLKGLYKRMATGGNPG